MKTKIVKVVSLLICIVLICTILSSCALMEALMKYAASNIETFEDKIKTTDDGFEYYVDPKIGVCILEFPQTEEVVVPEYIEGRKVVQFGYVSRGVGIHVHYVDGNHIKKLTITNYVEWYLEDGGDLATAWVNHLEELIYLDIKNYIIGKRTRDEMSSWTETVGIPYCVGSTYVGAPKPIVELKKSNNEFNMEDFKATVIYIPDYVKVIESGVFDGLVGVTIKTSYETKPEGWQDGWNGTCDVMWGITEEEAYRSQE